MRVIRAKNYENIPKFVWLCIVNRRLLFSRHSVYHSGICIFVQHFNAVGWVTGKAPAGTRPGSDLTL